MGSGDACAQERMQLARSAFDDLPGIESDDPLARAAERFPMGRGLEPVNLGDEPPSGPETRPFGLRYLTPVAADRANVLDASGISYDPETQMSTIDEEPLIVAATKQPTKYSTTTKEDRQEFEDVEEDTVDD